MAAGSILVDLLLRTGSFETDSKRAEKALQRFQKQAVDTGKVLGTALAAGAITAAYAFDKLIKGAAEFKDLEETTGASAEDLASLAIAAETAGVGMDTLAANSIRLTKGLTGVDDESKAAGAGIKALGLDLAEFKALDPVAQVDALTKAFANFKDGPEKAAVATALWGKSGAEMLKVMKALEEQGGRTTILTQTQIDQADAYADAQAKSTAELRLYAQAAATQGAPAFLALTNAASDFIKELIGVDKETGKLAQSTAIKDFADSTVRALAFVVDVGDGVGRVFTLIGRSLGALAAAAVSVATGEFRQAGRIIDEFIAEREAILQREFFSDKVAARLGGGTQGTGPDARPRLNFSGAQSGARNGRAGRNPSMSMEQVWRVQQDAEEDFLKESAEAWSYYDKRILKQAEERADAEKMQWQQVFDFIDAEQDRAIEEGKAFLDAQVKQADTFAKKFAENAQDVLGQGLYDMMTGNFKNIGDAFAQMITRMVAEAAAAELARALFGGMVKGGSGSGFLGDLATSLFSGFRADGGPVEAGRSYVVGERGPEVFTPRTSGMVMSNEALGAARRGGDTNHFNIAVSSNGYMDRAAEDRAAASIARKASRFMNRRSA
jgi:hypothetical protein